MELVMFEDADGMEVYVNPERMIWIREHPNQTTVIITQERATIELPLII
jgi:hypothetical protein